MLEYGFRYLRPCPTPAELAERDNLLRALAKLMSALWENKEGPSALVQSGLAFLHGDLDGSGRDTKISLTPLGQAALDAAREGEDV